MITHSKMDDDCMVKDKRERCDYDDFSKHEDWDKATGYGMLWTLRAAWVCNSKCFNFVLLIGDI